MNSVRYSHFPPIAGDKSHGYGSQTPHGSSKNTSTVLIDGPLDPDSLYRETLQSFQAQFRGASFKHKQWESSKFDLLQSRRQREIPTWRRDPMARSLSKQESNRGLKYRYKTFRYKGPGAQNANETSRDPSGKRQLHLPQLYSDALITRSMELSGLTSSDSSTRNEGFRWNLESSRPDGITDNVSESEFDDIYLDEDDIKMNVSSVFRDPSYKPNNENYSRKYYTNHGRFDDCDINNNINKNLKIFKIQSSSANSKTVENKSRKHGLSHNLDGWIEKKNSPRRDTEIDPENDPFGLLNRKVMKREPGLHITNEKKSASVDGRNLVQEAVDADGNVDAEMNADDEEEDDDEEEEIEPRSVYNNPENHNTNINTFETEKVSLPIVSNQTGKEQKKINYKSIIGDRLLIHPDCYDEFARDTLPKLPETVREVDSAFSSRIRRKVRL